MSVSPMSSPTAGSGICRASSSVKPLKTITVMSRSFRARARTTAPAAWASGSPPRKVIPSTPFSRAASISLSTSAAVRLVPPSKGSISGLQHPGQRSGHPWNHRAKRTPGPSASVTGTVCATLRIVVSRDTASLRWDRLLLSLYALARPNLHHATAPLLALDHDLALQKPPDHVRVGRQVPRHLRDDVLRRAFRQRQRQQQLVAAVIVHRGTRRVVRRQLGRRLLGDLL